MHLPEIFRSRLQSSSQLNAMPPKDATLLQSTLVAQATQQQTPNANPIHTTARSGRSVRAPARFIQEAHEQLPRTARVISTQQPGAGVGSTHVAGSVEGEVSPRPNNEEPEEAISLKNDETAADHDEVHPDQQSSGGTTPGGKRRSDNDKDTDDVDAASKRRRVSSEGSPFQDTAREWVEGGPHFRLEEGQWYGMPCIMHKTEQSRTLTNAANTQNTAQLPTLLGLPIELRRNIWGYTLQHDCVLFLDKPEDAIACRQAPADMARFNHIRREHLELMELRDQRLEEMTGIQKRRLRELDSMGYEAEMKKTLGYYDLHKTYFDASLLEVSKQIEQEARIEFLQVNDFAVYVDLQATDGLADVVCDTSMVHPRQFSKGVEQVLSYARSIQVCVSWHDIQLLSLRLSKRTDLRYLRIVFLGPVDTVLELQTFLKPLETLAAREVDLEWSRSEYDSQNEPRHKFLPRDCVEDYFDTLVEVMQSGGSSESKATRSYPEEFREGYWETQQ